MDNTSTHRILSHAVLAFLLGGKALVTLLNRNTEGRFTYRIKAPGKTAEERRESEILFVHVLTGPENGEYAPFENGSYTYIGLIIRKTGQFVLTKGSKLPMSNPRVAGFDWLMRQARKGTLDRFPHVEVRHHNQCGACARTLTVPESIDTGLGPICAKRLGVKWLRDDQRDAA